MVGGQGGEIGQGWGVLSPKGKYRAHMLVVSWLSKADGGGSRGSLWEDVDMQVEVVACRVGEIERGVGCFAPNGRYRPYALDIAWPSKGQGGKSRESMFNGFAVVIGTTVCWVGEIARGVRFGWQNQKPSHAGSALVLFVWFKVRCPKGSVRCRICCCCGGRRWG